ncbi:CBS domain-containing protein [Candidatus Woesearchaeota archaeon]|nr:CBS domain-containing protein [Candidatus Woesearchaeota archaeon]
MPEKKKEATLSITQEEEQNIKKLSSSIFRGVFRRVLSSILNKNVEDIMTRNVKTVASDLPLIRAAYIMVKDKISSLIVTKGDKVVGILTEDDFLLRRFSEKELSELRVENTMTKRVFSINKSQTVMEATLLMRDKRIRKLPVMENNKLVGIITQTDIVRHMDSLLSKNLLDRIDIKTVADVMTKDTVTVTKDTGFIKAMKMMGDKRLGCLIVVDNKIPVGIVTERDVMNEIVVNADILQRFKVEDVMTPSLLSISSGHKLFSANSFMIRKGVRRLPVVENGKLLGIVTETDLMRGMYELVEKILKKI